MLTASLNPYAIPLFLLLFFFPVFLYLFNVLAPATGCHQIWRPALLWRQYQFLKSFIWRGEYFCVFRLYFFPFALVCLSLVFRQPVRVSYAVVLCLSQVCAWRCETRKFFTWSTWECWWEEAISYWSWFGYVCLTSTVCKWLPWNAHATNWGLILTPTRFSWHIFKCGFHL